MGSVIVSEVVQDAVHFPHPTMLATAPHVPHHQTRSTTTSSSTSVPAVANAATPNTSIYPRTSASSSSSNNTRSRAPTSPRGGSSTGSARPQPINAEHSAQPSKSSSTTQSSTSSTRSCSSPPSPKRVKIKDLNHIQTFVQNEHSVESMAATGQIPADKAQELPQYEISGMPVTDVIEMVAGLLTKITTTNDEQAERLHKNMPAPEHATKMNPLSNSVLAFHGKNIPTISIMSYLSRIHKYCPATYEVFLSLLVYFDRITEKINASPRAVAQDDTHHAASRPQSRNSDTSAAPCTNIETSPTELKPHQGVELNTSGDERFPRQSYATSEYPSPPPSEPDPYDIAQCFVVDSFNIHRLIIAGVTCASKFFSDIFYTNSRYAKVGGLPLPELNNLEVQFLLLNDFRLSIPAEELEQYGTMLVEFYAREVIAQRHESETMGTTEVERQ